ncbi:hypothetical protein AZ78_2544 [Lysobacter capsici AZ78]|uniref:Uncharacterized protein n=1 Tax=Lysobacter capsici AZ78 TaxID=1444315 RepID=A0A108U9F4_9GAMM|nr:hypothetical protein AZ78_2544 [Lysobacter capsici AZ78]
MGERVGVGRRQIEGFQRSGAAAGTGRQDTVRRRRRRVARGERAVAPSRSAAPPGDGR